MMRGIRTGFVLVAAMGLPALGSMGIACGGVGDEGSTSSADVPVGPNGQAAGAGGQVGPTAASAQPQPQQGGEAAGAAAGAAPAAGPTLPGICSMAQLIGVQQAMVAAEIDKASLALGQATEAAVRSFAQQALDQYTQIARQMVDSASAQGIQPATSDLAQQIAEHAQQSLAAINGSMQFDRDYLASEALDHATMLGLVDAMGQPGGAAGDQAAPSGQVPTTGQAPANGQVPVTGQAPTTGQAPVPSMTDMIAAAHAYLEQQIQTIQQLESTMLGCGAAGGEPQAAAP